MASSRGKKTKGLGSRPLPCELTTEQRLQLVASLIIDRIAYDQANDQPLLRQIQKEPRLCPAK